MRAWNDELLSGIALYATSPRHCEEQRDEAIQLSTCGAMDCFAALAMTVETSRLLFRPVIGDAADYGARPELLPQTIDGAFGMYGAPIEHIGVVGL